MRAEQTGPLRMADASGALVVLLERLGGREGEAWLEWLIKFNQKENPWPDRDAIQGHISQNTSGEPEARMLRAVDAAKYLGVAPMALAKRRLVGDPPPFYKFGRTVLYDRAELDEWLSTLRRRATSEPG